MYDDTRENGGNANISSETIKDICYVLEKNLIEYVSQKIMLPRIVKLFLMAEKNLRNNAKESYLVELYRQGVRKDTASYVQWEPQYPLRNENNLWNISAMREVQGRLSTIVDDTELSDRFSALEAQEDPSLGLMLWLFPTLATEERLKTVDGIVCKDLRNWTLRDKMLFWLAYVQNHNNRLVAAHVEEQILRLQLDSGAFANVEGKVANEDVISSAIGLLVLVFCAKLKDPNCPAFDAARKTANWIVVRLKGMRDVDALSRAWALYAFSEFINLPI